ncbi:chemotaxis protein CheY [Bradyrhizobium sp. NAS80.1]|uniref:response regulator n=1 Tax=Bradyrhizobium sp. NAS80.1 TaxID=1680159 RepID=UPI0009662887|nr:response regulator [Bradyrhizobium sp. NAS80.1]OKO74603.1 chemotaxis protein CheY [Bradyrhizobium sp. NAS80.1]
MSGSNKELTGCRVLIVEDEYFLANDLEEALKSRGANIIGPFGDFDAAYRRAARDHFDVAIIDVNLHDKTAYPIADELVRQRIPFVFYTGYGSDIIPERFADVKRFQKPFDPLELVEDIGRLCPRGSD